MAHEIDTRNGISTFAFTGPRSAIWHGLGQQMTDDATDAEWRAASGLDFRVCRSRVRFGEGANQQTWDGQHVLFRSDTKEPIAVVSDGYKIVQPGEAFDFFKTAARDVGLSLSTAGSLKGGRKFFASAKYASGTVVAGDSIDGYLMFATSCDGSMNTVVKNVQTRPVCHNTLSVALSERGGRTVKVSHRSVFDHEKVALKMALIVKNHEKFIADARALSQYGLAPGAAHDLIAQIMGAPAPESVNTQADRDAVEGVLKSAGFNKVLGLFAGEGRGATMPGVRGTAWGVLNAVTQYFDHEIRATSADNRTDAAWFGTGDTAKQDAYKFLMDRIAA